MERHNKHDRKAASEFYKASRGGGCTFAEIAFKRDLRDGLIDCFSQIKQLLELVKAVYRSYPPGS